MGLYSTVHTAQIKGLTLGTLLAPLQLCLHRSFQSSYPVPYFLSPASFSTYSFRSFTLLSFPAQFYPVLSDLSCRFNHFQCWSILPLHFLSLCSVIPCPALSFPIYLATPFPVNPVLQCATALSYFVLSRVIMNAISYPFLSCLLYPALSCVVLSALSSNDLSCSVGQC